MTILVLWCTINGCKRSEYVSVQNTKKHTVGTKKFPPLWDFFCFAISLSFLESEWKILYRLKAEILNFFIVWKFFLYFEDILGYHFWHKNHTFFHKSKNIISPTQIKKIFHLWKLQVPWIILQKKILEKIVFIHQCNLGWTLVTISDKVFLYFS